MRAGPTLRRVVFSVDEGGAEEHLIALPTYLLLRWMAPYRFTMVAIQDRKYPNCDMADPMPDNPGTLFPQQDRRR